MSSPANMQVGGPALVAAAGARRLAFTGVHGLKLLVQLGTGLIVVGAAFLRRGRSSSIQPGHPIR